MNFTNSGDSFSSAVYERSGFADVRHVSGCEVLTCSASFVVATALPPWQSVHDSVTAADVCIGSMPVWQLTHESLVLSPWSLVLDDEGEGGGICAEIPAATMATIANPISLRISSSALGRALSTKH